MRRAAVLICCLAVLAGCGGSDGSDGKKADPFASATPVAVAPPDSEQLKYDLLTAGIQLEAYKLAEGTYTADETQLGPAFPPTVTIREADTDSYYMAAYDSQKIRYVLRYNFGVKERTCDPPDPTACPDGQW